MTRQERFEIVYADQNNMRPEDFVQYRMGDTYRLPAIARAHRYFCSGWDACADDESLYHEEPSAPMTQEQFERLPVKTQECFNRLSAMTLFGDSNIAPTVFSGLAPKTDTE